MQSFILDLGLDLIPASPCSCLNCAATVSPSQTRSRFSPPPSGSPTAQATLSEHHTRPTRRSKLQGTLQRQVSSCHAKLCSVYYVLTVCRILSQSQLQLPRQFTSQLLLLRSPSIASSAMLCSSQHLGNLGPMIRLTHYAGVALETRAT